MNKLYWAKVKPDAKIPQKRYEDAGYDLYPCFEEDYMVIEPHETKLVPLGVASAFDPEFVMILKERGSTGTKGIAQRSGVIDSGYRGEYMAPVTNLNTKRVVIKKQNVEYKEDAIIYPYEKAISFTGNRVDFNCALAFMIIIPVIIAKGLCPLALRIAPEK